MLILQYHLTKEEFFEFSYYTTWSSPDRKGYRARYYLRVLVLYAAVAALYIFMNRHHNIVIDLSVFSLIALVYLLLIPTLVKRSIRSRVKAILNDPENAHVLQEAKVTLSDTGIIDQDTASETHYNWDAIVKKTETSTAYYLYTNSYHAVLIPKRAIVHPSDTQELQRLFNDYLPLSSEVA